MDGSTSERREVISLRWDGVVGAPGTGDPHPCTVTEREQMSFSHPVRKHLAVTTAGAFLATIGLVGPAVADDHVEPKNIIHVIVDGIGFNYVDAVALYEHGQSYYQANVVTDPEGGAPIVERLPNQGPRYLYQDWDVQLAMSNHSLSGPEYTPEAFWSDFGFALQTPTDSAAAATTLASGTKTINGYLGLDENHDPVRQAPYHAQQGGRSVGVVTDVNFGHATPAAYAVEVESRNFYHEIAEQLIFGSPKGNLDVVIGAGHPYFDNNGQPRDPNWTWITEQQYTALQDGQTGKTFVETSAGIEAIAAGEDVPDTLFALAPVADTLQQSRSTDGNPDGDLPWSEPANDIVSLADLATAALNVLGKNEHGFFLVVEAGAVDWAGHANQATRIIEEMQAANAAVEAIVDWVETNSSWDETLIVLTGDHETGYLNGPDSDPDWNALTGNQGELPQYGWHTGGHSNQLIPFYAHGVGSEYFLDAVRGTDPVHGDYIDNVDVGNSTFDLVKVDHGQHEGIELDVTVPAPGEGGPGDGALVLSIADNDGVALTGGHNVGDARRFLGTLPTISVTDSRSDAEAGANGGWSVSGQSSDLVAEGRTIRAGHLGWTPALVEPRQGIEAGSRIPSILRDGPGLAQPQTLGSASSEGRVGTTGLTAELRLEVPVTTQGGEYGGELTVSLFPVD